MSMNLINKDFRIKQLRKFAKENKSQIKKLSTYMIMSLKNISSLNIELINQFKYINPKYSKAVCFRIKSWNTIEEWKHIN